MDVSAADPRSSGLDSVMVRALAPRAVAVYGASARKPNNQPARIAANLVATGYAERLVLVNPSAQELHGITTVARATDSPLADRLDLAVIAVPAVAVVDAVDDCADAGIGLAIVTSAGFAETDEHGKALQEQLAARAAARGVRLVGPNCMGMINFTEGLVAAGRPFDTSAGRISVVAQSGYLSMRLMSYIAETGQGIDVWATMGNSADLTPADLIDHLGTREQTSVIVVYLENVPDPQRLSEAIRRARAAGTDVVLLKSGRTTVGSQIAASHTGALASPDVFVDVLAQEADAIRVDTLREAAQAAALIAAFGRRPTGPFLVTSGSGGDCVLAGDACSSRDIPLARLSAVTVDRLHALVPQAASGNPLDLTPFPFDGTGRQLGAARILAEEPDVGCVVLMDGWGFDSRETPEGLVPVLHPLVDAEGRTPVPVIVDSRVEPWLRDGLVAAGLGVTSDGETIWRTLAHIVRQARAAGTMAEPEAAPAVDSTANATPPPRLPELEAFQRLSAAGVPMVPTVAVADAGQLREACATLGFPIVLKGLVEGIVHKADEQLVHVDLRDDDEALAAWSRLHAAVEPRGGTVVVQPQLRGALAEIIVATRDDPAYGLHVMVGSGGTWVESDPDVQWAKAPLTEAAADRLLRRTRIGRSLVRKHPTLFDDTGLPAVVAGLSDVAARWASDVAEIEINPLMLRPDVVQAVDAVVTLRSAERNPS